MGSVRALGKDYLHFLEGSINAEKYIDMLEQHVLLSKWNHSENVHAFFNKSMQKHMVRILQMHGTSM